MIKKKKEEQRIKSSLLIDKRKIVQGKAWWQVWTELKQKYYNIHFKSFKLEWLSSKRAHIFPKASISWFSRTGVDLTSSSCSSRTCTTSSCSTWWDSIRGNDCSNWASSVHRSATLNLIVWISAIKDIVLWDASARRSSMSASCWIRLTGLDPSQYLSTCSRKCWGSTPRLSIPL